MLKGEYIYTSWYDYPGAIRGTTENALIEWFQQNASPNEVWLDIGAHYGYTSLALCRIVGRGGKVYAFEPMLHSAGCIQKTREKNHLNQLYVLPVALGQRAVSALSVEQLPTTRGMLDSTVDVGKSTWFDTFWQTDLDWLWAQIDGGRVDGIKIDVQGMEISTLMGMKELILRDQPKLVIELHDGVNRLLFRSFVEELGYSVDNAVLIDSLGGKPESEELLSDRSYAFPRQIDVAHG